MDDEVRVETFIDDDEGFVYWRDSHPEGFIVNAARHPQADYLVLHRASCPFLRLPNASLHWTRSYIKICANDANELDRWGARNVEAFHGLTPCPVCKP